MLGLAALAACRGGDAGQPAQARRARPRDGPIPQAVGRIDFLPDRVGRAFHATDAFAPLPVPDGTDWLGNFHERNESVADFLAGRPNLPQPSRNTIVVAALSPLEEAAPALPEVLEYVHHFYGLPVEVMPDLPPLKARRRRRDGFDQLNATDLLDALVPLVPSHAYGVIALTTEDLYPRDDVNYVFGIARLTKRVSVFSFARYANDDRKVAARRGLKICSHELGHMFGVGHCTHFSCNMNGVNHRDELDRAPMHVCPVCLRKLHVLVGFDPAMRYQLLARSLRTFGLDEEARWAERRIEFLASA